MPLIPTELPCHLWLGEEPEVVVECKRMIAMLIKKMFQTMEVVEEVVMMKRVLNSRLMKLYEIHWNRSMKRRKTTILTRRVS